MTRYFYVRSDGYFYPDERSPRWFRATPDDGVGDVDGVGNVTAGHDYPADPSFVELVEATVRPEFKVVHSPNSISVTQPGSKHEATTMARVFVDEELDLREAVAVNELEAIRLMRIRLAAKNGQDADRLRNVARQDKNFAVAASLGVRDPASVAVALSNAGYKIVKDES